MQKNKCSTERVSLQERMRLVEIGEGGSPIDWFPMQVMYLRDVYAYLSYVYKEIDYMEIYNKIDKISFGQLTKVYDGYSWAGTEKGITDWYEAKTMLELVYVLPSEIFHKKRQMSMEDEPLLYEVLIRPFLPIEEAIHKEYDFSE